MDLITFFYISVSASCIISTALFAMLAIRAFLFCTRINKIICDIEQITKNIVIYSADIGEFIGYVNKYAGQFKAVYLTYKTFRTITREIIGQFKKNNKY